MKKCASQCPAVERNIHTSAGPSQELLLPLFTLTASSLYGGSVRLLPSGCGGLSARASFPRLLASSQVPPILSLSLNNTHTGTKVNSSSARRRAHANNHHRRPDNCFDCSRTRTTGAIFSISLSSSYQGKLHRSNRCCYNYVEARRGARAMGASILRLFVTAIMSWKVKPICPLKSGPSSVDRPINYRCALGLEDFVGKHCNWLDD